MARYGKLSSSELLKKCAGSKNEAAWAELVARSYPVIAAAVLRTARRWCEPSRAQVEDLIQDTYLKLCEDNGRLLGSFQPQHKDAIYGFLRVVAANVVHDHYKSERAVKRGAGQTGAITEPVEAGARAAGADSFAVVDRQLRLETIDRVLLEVTAGKDQERKRMVFWLRHRQGLTAGEIAAVPSVGLTTEGVESMLMRLTIAIRTQILDSISHREVKVLKRQNRSNRKGS